MSEFFKEGDMVWINKIHNMDDPSWIREPQTVESIWEVPVGEDGNYYMEQAIHLRNIPYIFSREDLLKIKK
jgi:hypothetical protein